jgi:hypothetical protein
MKTVFFSFTLLMLTLAACSDADTKNTSSASTETNGTTISQDVAMGDTANYTTIEWLDSIQQDLGKIKEGEMPEISWRFRNAGDKPLVIVNASGTCGCTVAEKPEQPIPPGETGVIKAKFSSEGRVGPNNKQVIVTANAKGPNPQYLDFTVIVEKQ